MYKARNQEICLKLWEDEPCQKFKVSRNGIARIDVWVHEFSELGVKRWFQLIRSEEEMVPKGVGMILMRYDTMFMSQLVSIKLPDGEMQTHRIDHVLTSLVRDSVLKSGADSFRLIQPDEYEKLIEDIPVIVISN